MEEKKTETVRVTNEDKKWMKSSLLEKMNKTLNNYLLKNQNRCFIHVDFILVSVPEFTYLESRRTTVENILAILKPAWFIYLFNF